MVRWLYSTVFKLNTSKLIGNLKYNLISIKCIIIDIKVKLNSNFSTKSSLLVRKDINILLVLLFIILTSLIINSLNEDVFSIDFSINVNSQIGATTNVWTNGVTNINDVSSSSIFLLLSKGIKKLPTGVKTFFTILFIIIFVLKLFGYNLIDLYINDKLLRIYLYCYGSVMIIFILLNLYLLHKAYKGQLQISAILPKFIQTWLNGFIILSNKKSVYDNTKETFYLNLMIYIVSLIIITFLK